MLWLVGELHRVELIDLINVGLEVVILGNAEEANHHASKFRACDIHIWLLDEEAYCSMHSAESVASDNIARSRVTALQSK